METQSVFVSDIAHFLATAFTSSRYPAEEHGGLFRESECPVRRLGLALEPFAGLPQWVIHNQLDALWLHRPWQLDLALLPPDLGVLYNHLPFDETLTIGFNERMAAQLANQSTLEPLGYKQATDNQGNLLPKRAIGMLMNTQTAYEFDAYLQRVKTMFNGYDRAEAGRQELVSRVAVVGAMTDTLVREAVERGANLYVTGQYRKPAQDAVDETGLAVIAVGHRRTEEWGLRALADLLREQWPTLTVVIGG